MKKQMSLFIVLLLFSVCSLFAGPFDMISAHDPVLDDLRFISLETGKSFLSFTPPLSPAEIEQFLGGIDVSILSEPGRQAFSRIRNRLNPQANISISSEFLTVFLNINSTIEGIFRTTDEIGLVPHNIKVPHLFSLPINFYFADFLQLYIEPFIGAPPNFYQSNDTFLINTPLDLSLFDDSQPHRAFMAAGGPWWNFQFGRDRLFWGTGNTGSLSFSDNSPYFDFMRASFFSEFLKYSVMVNQLPLREVDRIISPEIKNRIGDDYLKGTTQRYFYVHRVDFNFFNRLSLGFTEGLMAGNSALELRFLSPLMLFHSMSSWFDYNEWIPGTEMNSTIGSFFSIEVNWNIFKSLAFYGQFAMNEVALPGELADRPLQPPNGLGLMAGLQYSHSFENWGAQFFIEFIQTDPYIYLNPSPFASLIQMIGLNVTDNQYYYLGYPRDTRTLALGARFFNGNGLSFSGELSWISKGQHGTNSVLWDWEVSEEAFNQNTPSGTAQDSYIVTLGAGWKPLPYLTFNGSVSGIMSLNNNHVSGSDTFGGQLVFSVNFTY